MGAYLFWTAKAGDNRILYFDVCQDEQHDLASDIVEHPVEQGVDITDHIRPKVPQVSLTGFVSNTPIYSKSEIAGFIAASGPNPTGKIIGAQNGDVKGVEIKPNFYEPPLQPTPGSLLTNGLTAIANALFGRRQYKANVLKFDTEFDNVKDIYRALDFARGEAQLFNVVTSSRVYSNMGLMNINVSRNPETGTGAIFKLDLKQVHLVSTQRATLPTPKEPSGKKSVNKGTKNTKEVEESVAIKLLDKLGNFTGVQITPGQH